MFGSNQFCLQNKVVIVTSSFLFLGALQGWASKSPRTQRVCAWWTSPRRSPGLRINQKLIVCDSWFNQFIPSPTSWKREWGAPGSRLNRTPGSKLHLLSTRSNPLFETHCVRSLDLVTRSAWVRLDRKINIPDSLWILLGRLEHVSTASTKDTVCVARLDPRKQRLSASDHWDKKNKYKH